MSEHEARLRSNAREWEISECSERARWSNEAADEIERLQTENEVLRRGFRASRRKNVMYRTGSSKLPEWCHAALAAAIEIEPATTERPAREETDHER